MEIDLRGRVAVTFLMCKAVTEREQSEHQRPLSTLTLRRWETADDVADLICSLASDRAAYITGTLIDISGGKFATQVPGSAYAYAESGDPSSVP